MIRTLLAAALLIQVSHPVFAEKIDAELLCEGHWNIDFHTPKNGEDTFASMLLIEMLQEQMTPEQKWFSERLSIKDSVLYENVPLEVSDTFIEADKSAIPSKLASDLPFEVRSANLKIDRLTGKIIGDIEIEKFHTESDFFNERPEDAEFRKSLSKLVKGFEFEGDCRKLDPKKKLF